MKWLCIPIALPALVFAASPYAGDQPCTACHREQAMHYGATAMSRALEPAATAYSLAQHPKLTFREGPYATTITRERDRSILTVTDGAETLTAPLEWAFGQKHSGQTYVFEHNGALYETRVSFYSAINGLDLTMGAQQKKPATLEEAAGRRMDAADARECFGCHATGAIVGSEACVGRDDARRALRSMPRSGGETRCGGSRRQSSGSEDAEIDGARRRANLGVVRPVSSHLVDGCTQRPPWHRQCAISTVPIDEQQMLQRRRCTDFLRRLP